MTNEQPKGRRERREFRASGQPYCVVDGGVLYEWGTPRVLAMWEQAKLSTTPLLGAWAND